MLAWRATGLVLCLAVLLVVPSIASAAGRGAKPGQDVLRATLDNGLRVVIVRNPLAPVVTTAVNYLVGSNEAPRGFPGMAHAQEHMMFRGSSSLSANQLADIAASMGGMFDADTQQMVTQYFFTVPAQDLDVALHIEAIRMRSVLDSESLWKKERGAIEQEVAQDLSNPNYVYYRQLLATLFKDTPYAHDALGTKISFDKTTGAMLKNFHDTWYAPNNAILVIVGDVKPSQTLGRVRRLFGDIPAEKLPARPVFHFQPVKAQSSIVKTDLPVGLVVVTFRSPGYKSPDYAPMRVLADVLNSQRAALYGLVPEGKALFAGFSLTTLPQAGLGQVIAGFPKGADPRVLLKQVEHVLTQVAAHGVPADLVAVAKHREAVDAEFRRNSISGQAMAWSQALAIEGRHSPQDIVRALEQVSVADVNRVARTYLDQHHAVVGILLPHYTGKSVSSKTFGGTESFAFHQTRSIQLPGWAVKALQRLSIPNSTVHPVETRMPNGITLIVCPEPASDTVTICGHIENRPELEVARGQEGVDLILDQLFSFGTTTLDRLAFQKALDDIAGDVEAGTDFSLQVSAKDLDRGVQLLAGNELHPALPEKGFRIVRRQVADTVAGQLQSPGYLFGRAVMTKLLPKGDPALRQATPETVSSVSLQDVKAYYKKVFRPDLTTIVVIGKVTPEKAQAVLARYFGAWKAVGAKPKTLLPPVGPNKASDTVVADPSRVQDNVILAQTLGLTRSNPDYYALKLGNHVLGGGFYATRLYQDLREKTGLVYSVDASLDVGRTRATYMVQYGCNPLNVSKARAIIQRNIVEMQTTPVPAEQLRQAKAMLLREMPLEESSIDSIAQDLLSRSVSGLPLDESIRAAHRYLSLTPEQVRKAFEKWVRPNDWVQVTQGPEPR